VLPAIALLVGLVLWGFGPGTAYADGPWNGYTPDGVRVRAGPDTSSPVVRELAPGAAVQITAWVQGETVVEDNGTWGMLAPGQYVYSALIRRSPSAGPPPPPANAIQPVDWVDVNLTQQTIAAYSGDGDLLYWAVVSTGRPEYPTPRGTFTIVRRAAVTTMTSAGLSWIKDSYVVPNVHFAQYFTWQGAALHENYWKTENSPWGVPTSHGCVGMKYADANWFWVWAKVGTPVVVHN
jgi:hypothetical protein